MSKLRKEIEHVINCDSAENGSNTPDFILAEYLTDCLAAFDKAVNARDVWYGIDQELTVIEQGGEDEACRDHLTKLFPQQECPYCKVAGLEEKNAAIQTRLNEALSAIRFYTERGASYGQSD